MEGIAIIMIEHRLRELFRIIDKVMVMNFGEKITEGEPQEVMETEKVKEAYLGIERRKT
jgi:branched-chain amino acid transport system ATP-binding protein